LVQHNRYQILGGEDTVVAAEKELLESKGHKVFLQQEDNRQISGAWAKLTAAGATVYSRTARRRVAEDIAQVRPDVVHVHNFFPLLSPSLYYACRDARVPVVQTLHNYRLVCPNALLFRDDHVCEDCLHKTVAWPGILHACYRQSRLATAPIVAMLAAHRLAGTWANLVDVYIALTEFARLKLIEGGLPANKIVVKPNFLHDDRIVRDGHGVYAVYVGRLSVEKGIRTLLAAWEKIGTTLPLKIAGDGPLAHEVEAATQRLPGVTWLGRLDRDRVMELMCRAYVLIFPSLWYEGLGMTLLEAFALGLPVISRKMGGAPSIVEHGRTGLLFEADNVEDLSHQVLWAHSHPAEMQKMRIAAREEYEAKYTGERNYEILMRIYERAIENSKSRGR
jgi:glycosyltransferase involved in cell wall biosynthesis